MDYIEETIERLEEYNLLISAIENIKTELQTLLLEKNVLKAQNLSFTQAGTSGHPDDRIANNIAKRLELNKRLKITENRINQINRAMIELEEDEKILIELLFINGCKNSIDYACEKIGVEKARIYQLRRKSLEKIGRALLGYGIA